MQIRQTCVTRGWCGFESTYWVLQRKRRKMNRASLVNGYSDQAWSLQHANLVWTLPPPPPPPLPSPTPWSVFCLEIQHKLLILLLNGTQPGYLHADSWEGEELELSVKADIKRYQEPIIETSIRSRLVLRLLVFLCKSITLVKFFLKTVSEKVRLFLHVLPMSGWIWIEQVRQPNYQWDVKWSINL